MQKIDRRATPRTKSALLFIPKSHKSAHSSIVGSICPVQTRDLKHADPNRPRVIAAEFDLTPTPISTSRKRKSAESDKSTSSSDSEGSVLSVSSPKTKKRKTVTTDSDKSSPIPISTSRKRKSAESEKSSSDSEGSVRTPKAKKRKTVTTDSDESSGSKSKVRVEGPSKLMKAARKNYNKVAIRRKIDAVTQLVDPLARVRSPTPPTASSKVTTISDVVVEELTPRKPLPVRPLNHPRTKTALFIPKPVAKPISVSGPMSLTEYARRCSEAGPALC